jgi:hypothetical protein
LINTLAYFDRRKKKVLMHHQIIMFIGRRRKRGEGVLEFMADVIPQGRDHLADPLYFGICQDPLGSIRIH